MGIISRFPGGGGGSGKTSIINAIVTLDSTQLVYDGTVKTQTITSVMLNGIALTAGEDYSIKDSSNTATNAGDHHIILEGINNFEGTKTVPWTIAKATGAVSLNPTSLTLGASGQTGTIAVTRSGDGAVSVSVNNDAVSVSVDGTTVTVTCLSSVAATAVVTVNVAASANYDAASATCAVNIVYTQIFGIERNANSSSPVWTRTDGAIGKTATASIGTAAGSSDFDSIMPWSGIERETLSTNDVMVRIPKFWYQRYKDAEDIEHIRIADSAVDGFTLHPAFNHAGVEKDYLYVGAYKTSSNNCSVSGVAPQASQTRATFRTSARAKGSGWSLIDIATWSAIQMLILVEFATNDVQTVIGMGYCDANTTVLNTGTCNNVPNLTGRPANDNAGKVDVIWRGIESYWGNIYEWVDGLNWNSGTYYVCNNPSNYGDDTATGYTALSYTGATNWSAAYITAEGLDDNNSHVMLPSAAGSGGTSEYYCDAIWSTSGWTVPRKGGRLEAGFWVGLFTMAVNTPSGTSDTRVGSRLIYIPQ